MTSDQIPPARRYFSVAGSAASQPARFTLHAVSILVAILAMVVVVGRVLGSAVSVASAIGQSVGALLLACLAGWLGYRLAGRSNLLGNGLFCGMFVLAACAPSLNAARTAKNKAVLDDMKRDRSALLAEASARLESPDDNSADASQWDNQIAVLDKGARESTGDQAAIFRAMAETMREMRQSVIGYAAAVNELNDSGGIDIATLDTREAVKRRQRCVAAFEQANDELRKKFAELPDAVGRRLTGSASKVWNRDVRKLIGGMGLDLISAMRDEDRKVATSMATVLCLLDREWGKWSVRDQPPSPRFESNGALNEYNRAAEQVTAAAERRGQLQQELIERAQARHRN